MKSTKGASKPFPRPPFVFVSSKETSRQAPGAISAATSAMDSPSPMGVPWWSSTSTPPSGGGGGCGGGPEGGEGGSVGGGGGELEKSQVASVVKVGSQKPTKVLIMK